MTLDAKARFDIENTLREVDSHNVVAKLEGSDPAVEESVRHLHRALGSSRQRPDP